MIGPRTAEFAALLGEHAAYLIDALEIAVKDRLRAGELWQDHGLVFASRIGTPPTANNVIRAFRIVTKKAGLGED